MKKISYGKDLKIILLGDTKTGKSTFVQKYTKNIFMESYNPTFSTELGCQVFQKNEKLNKIQIWDITGKDINKTLTNIFSKNADGCIIFSDSTNIKTRENSLEWKNCINKVAKFIDEGEFPSILVESKRDLLAPNQIKEYEENIKKFCEDNKFIGGFLISSKNGYNVKESIEFLLNNIIDRLEAKNANRNEEICENNKNDNNEEEEEENEKEEKENESDKKSEKEIVEEMEISSDEGDAEVKQEEEINEKNNIICEQLPDKLLKLSIKKIEDNEENEYLCKINLKELIEKYKILMPADDPEIFIKVINALNNANKIKIKYYAEKILIKLGIILTSLSGDEEEIEFELINKKIEGKDIIEMVVNELIELNEEEYMNELLKKRNKLMNEFKSEEKRKEKN